MKQVRLFHVWTKSVRLLLFFVLFLIVGATNSLFAQQLPQGNITASGTYTVPAGVTKIKIEAVGGGGAGGRSTNSGEATAGGGGGAYSRVDSYDVTFGDLFVITIGAGGVCKSTGAVNGGTTIITKNGATVITANGGTTAPVNGQTGATGGAASAGYSASFAGGSGGNANPNTAFLGSNSGAGGGGSAGWATKNGNNGIAGHTESGGDSGIVGAGGAGDGYLAGSGGAGVASQTAGNRGGNYGGGGGGVKRANAAGSNWDGGGGAQGVVKITFLCTTEYALTSTISSITEICQNATDNMANITFSGTTTNLPAGTYTVTYTVNGITQTPKNVTVNASGIGVITNVSIPTDQAGNVPIVITHLRNTASPNCENDISANNMVTVTVNPTPTITNTFTDQVICNGKQTTPVTFTGTATSFQWEATGDVISGMPEGVQTGNFSVYTLYNTTAGPLTATITVTPIYGADDAGTPCKGDAKSFTVTVHPTPQATISQDAEVCQGTEVTLTFELTTGTPPWSVTYSDDNGSRKTLTGATTTITDTVTPPVGTTRYDITEVTDSNGCVWDNNPK